MQVMNVKRNKPLYYKGYAGSTKVNWIQVDPDFALSIILLRLMQLLGILINELAPMNTIIFGFNANGSNPLGKIRLCC